MVPAADEYLLIGDTHGRTRVASTSHVPASGFPIRLANTTEAVIREVQSDVSKYTLIPDPAGSRRSGTHDLARGGACPAREWSRRRWRPRRRRSSRGRRFPRGRLPSWLPLWLQPRLPLWFQPRLQPVL